MGSRSECQSVAITAGTNTNGDADMSLFEDTMLVLHLQALKGAKSFHAFNFLLEHLHTADELYVRWKCEPGGVAFWGNRIVVHRAVPGHYIFAER